VFGIILCKLHRVYQVYHVVVFPSKPLTRITTADALAELEVFLQKYKLSTTALKLVELRSLTFEQLQQFEKV
jgi:hypothetical protein